jgi:hypothetical protein
MRGSIHRQLNRYVLVALVSLLVLAQPSLAKIVYTPVNVTLSGNGSIAIPQNGGTTQFTIKEVTQSGQCFDGSYFEATVSVSPRAGGNGVVGNGTLGDAFALSLGTPIGPGQSFDQVALTMAYEYDGYTDGRCGAVYYGDWCDDNSGAACDSVDAYLGLEIEYRGSIYYGWAQATVSPIYGRDSFEFSVQLTGYAYETIPGQSINAGQTSDDPDDSSFR